MRRIQKDKSHGSASVDSVPVSNKASHNMIANLMFNQSICSLGSHGVVLPGCVWHCGSEDDITAAPLSRRLRGSARRALPADHTEQTRPGKHTWALWTLRVLAHWVQVFRIRHPVVRWSNTSQTARATEAEKQRTDPNPSVFRQCVGVIGTTWGRVYFLTCEYFRLSVCEDL